MSPSAAIILIGGVALAVVVLFLVSRSRRSNDGVDSFRRQIDALSPEARRPVIDQIKQSPDRSGSGPEPRIETRSADSGADSPSPDSGPGNGSRPGADDAGADGEVAGEDGPHGT